MEIGETMYVTTREEFRAWLEANHKLRKEIWLIQYKKSTQKPSIPYADAVVHAPWGAHPFSSLGHCLFDEEHFAG